MAAVDRFLDETQAARERLADAPGDVAALAALGRAFDFLAFDQAEDVRQLVAAGNNLLDRLIEGVIKADPQSTTLLEKACLALRGSTRERNDMTEALDVFASGLGTLDEPPPAPAPPASPRSAAPVPPLLTIRDNGERVVPGTFEPASATTPAPTPQPTRDRSAAPQRSSPKSSVRVGRGRVPVAAEPETARSPVPEADTRPAPAPAVADVPRENMGNRPTAALLADFDAAVDRLSAQIGALALLGGANIERAIDELSATSAELARLKDEIELHMTK